MSPTPDRENSSASWWQNLVRMFKEKKIECHIRNQNRKRTAGERNESCYCDIEKINEEATIMKKIERDEVSLGGWKSTRKKNTSRLRVSFAVKNEMLFSLNRINIYRLTKEWDYCNNFGMSSKQAGKGDSNFRRTLKQNASESEGDVAGSIALELPPKKQKQYHQVR